MARAQLYFTGRNHTRVAYWMIHAKIKDSDGAFSVVVDTAKDWPS